MSRIRLAVLVSGGGSNLQAILDAIQSGSLDAEVACVISNRKAAFGLERARKFGIEDIYIGKGNYPEESLRDKALLEVLEAQNIDLIVLAGYLNILPSAVVKRFKGRIINVHPSLIPKYCGEGFYGHHVHEAVLAAGETESGATVHFVDEGVDTGAIIAQRTVPVMPDDTVETLSARVLKVEHRTLVETIIGIAEKRIKIGEEAAHEA